MSRERHRRASDVFVAAARLGPAERADFLDRECAGNAALRAEVESLLAHDPGDDDERFGDAPMPGVAVLMQSALAPVPAQIGRYRIDGVLGRGGMGVVYRAQQDNPPRPVAVKVLAAGARSEAALRRFEREAQALGRLQHPGIARIHEAGTADTGEGTQPFFAMELVDGVPITAWATTQQLDLRARLELLIQVCGAVQHAHDRGVVHRDLKPANILVDASGQPKVLDFGVARVAGDDAAATAERTAAGNVLGTIPYMSPEQANADARGADARTDVYALGVLAYELLCGELPHDLAGRSLAQMLAQVGTQAPIPLARREPRLRGDLDTIVGKALASDPARRYGSTGELAADLRRYLDYQPIAARPPSALYQVRMAVRRHRGLAAGLLVAALASIAGTALSVTWALRAEASARCANDERQGSDRLSAFLQQLFLAAAPAVARGQTITARDLVLRGHDAALRESGGSPTVQGRIMSLIGSVERQMGERARADEILTRAVAELRSAPADRTVDADLAQALRRLGELRYDQGRHDEAEDLLGEALALAESVDGPESAAAGELIYALATNASATGRYRESMAQIDRALAILEQRLGPHSPRVAMALDGAGCARASLGEHDAAAECYQRAIAILEADGEASLHLLASTLANLAILRATQGRPQQAGPSFRRALEIGEQIYAPDHPGLIVRLTNMGTFHASQGELAQAEPLLARALAIHEANRLGDQRPTGYLHFTLGQIQEQQERFDDALAAYARALGMFERLGGPATLPGSDVLIAIGRAQLGRSDPEAARDAYARALRIREAVHGSNHPALLESLRGLHDSYAALGHEADRQAVAARVAGIERAGG